MRKSEIHPHTVIINKKQKNQTKRAKNEALKWLAKRFPKAFDNTISIQPLKIGIIRDILVYANEAQAEGISISKLREAIVIFTRRLDYLTCLKAQEMRVDLEGNPVAKVTEEEAASAALKIKKYIEKSIKNSKKNILFRPLSVDKQNKYNSDLDLDLDEPIIKTERSVPTVMIKKSMHMRNSEVISRLKEKLGLKNGIANIGEKVSE